MLKKLKTFGDGLIILCFIVMFLALGFCISSNNSDNVEISCDQYLWLCKITKECVALRCNVQEKYNDDEKITNKEFKEIMHVYFDWKVNMQELDWKEYYSKSKSNN